MKHKITLFTDEVIILKNILFHFTDYVAGDDRPDHGWNILKDWRTASQQTKVMLYSLAGKLGHFKLNLDKRKR